MDIFKHKKWMLASLLFAASPAMAQINGTPYLGFGPGIQNTFGYTGLLASVSAGYSTILGPCQNLYLAGEIFGDTGTIPMAQNYNRRTNYGFGASILPGIYLRETVLAYLRLGIEHFRYSKTLGQFTGGQAGLGLQTSINKDWDIRGEYVYTGTSCIHGFTNPESNFVKVGLVFKFN